MLVVDMVIGEIWCFLVGFKECEVIGFVWMFDKCIMLVGI